jgi:hypothetical protein
MKSNLTLILSLSLLLFASSHAFSQAGKFFTPTGHLIKTDTFKTVGDIRKSLAPEVSTSVVEDKSGLHIVFYVPLIHKPLAVQCKDSVTAIRCIVQFNKEKYFRTGLFEADYNRIKRNDVDTNYIKTALGTPDKKYENPNLSDEKSYLYLKEQFKLDFLDGLLSGYSFLN